MGYSLFRVLRNIRAVGVGRITVYADGRLEQSGADAQAVRLDRLVSAHAEPNEDVIVIRTSRFGAAEEERRRYYGSEVLLLLTDDNGHTMTFNPGLWEDGQAIAEIVRAAVWDGDARVTPDAAVAYGLPERAFGAA